MDIQGLLQYAKIDDELTALNRRFNEEAAVAEYKAQTKRRTEMLVLVTGYIVDERSKVEDMIKRYNEAVKTLSIFEGKLAEQHEADLKREERIRRERETERRIQATLPEPPGMN